MVTWMRLTHRSWYKIRPSGAGAVALGGNLRSDMLQAKTLQLGAVWDEKCVHLYEFMDVVLMKHRETCWYTSYFDLCSIFSSMRSDAWQFFQKQAKHKRVRLYIYTIYIKCSLFCSHHSVSGSKWLFGVANSACWIGELLTPDTLTLNHL